MRPPARTSLRLRLLVFAALASGGALLLSWIGLSLLFERHAERQVAADLVRHGQTLAAAVRVGSDGRPVLAALPVDPRFANPASGLYWRLGTGAGELRSRSLWDGRWTPWPEAAPTVWRTKTTSGPFEPRIIRTARLIRPQADAAPVLVEVAATHEVVGLARAGFAGELALFLLVLWTALMGAAVVQVLMGLRPLSRVRRDLAGLRADPAARLDPASHPDEIAPLAAAINELADARERDMDAARHRARDLAHALKTPVAALRLQLAELPAAQRDALDGSVAVLTAAVEAELARAGAAGAARGSCELEPVIGRLIGVLQRTHGGAMTRIAVDIVPDLAVPLAVPVALETFGALLDNAVRHASGLVAVTARTLPDGGIEVCVADDGPGLPPGARIAALTRGVRLDEAGAPDPASEGRTARGGLGTQGLGLSIARAFVGRSGGALLLGTAAAGGLEVRLVWPAGAGRPPE